MTRITGTLNEDRYNFFIISRSIILRMRNVSGKSCRENQYTHFVFSNFFFFGNRTVYEIMWKKYGTDRQATDDTIPQRMRFVLWINKAIDTHTEDLCSCDRASLK